MKVVLLWSHEIVRTKARTLTMINVLGNPALLGLLKLLTAVLQVCECEKGYSHSALSIELHEDLTLSGVHTI